jgi:hypothetical protein
MDGYATRILVARKDQGRVAWGGAPLGESFGARFGNIHSSNIIQLLDLHFAHPSLSSPRVSATSRHPSSLKLTTRTHFPLLAPHLPHSLMLG